jgi:hypothetical protein
MRRQNKTVQIDQCSSIEALSIETTFRSLWIGTGMGITQQLCLVQPIMIQIITKRTSIWNRIGKNPISHFIPNSLVEKYEPQSVKTSK